MSALIYWLKKQNDSVRNITILSSWFSTKVTMLQVTRVTPNIHHVHKPPVEHK